MGWVGGVVVYAVLWFICLMLVAPRGQPTQIEAGQIEPGTPGGAPASIRMGRKFLYATVFALVVWLIIFVVLEYKILTLGDFDFLAPESLRSSTLGLE